MNRRRFSPLGMGLGLAALAAFILPAAAWAAPLAAEGGEGSAAGLRFAGLVPLIILFPVVGLLVNLAFGKQLGEGWAGFIASAMAGLSFLVSVLQLVALQGNEFHAVTVPLADWITIGELHVPWAFQVDTLSVTMMLVVTGVGTLIHIYAIGYEHSDVRHNGDPGRYPRFFVYLNLFLAAMLILVAADNYLMMFVGWEGVGLCSYLLIGFWFEKGENQVGNARAARKAFVANRVGDWAMLLALFLIFWNFGSLTYNEVFHHAEEMSAELMDGTLVTAITLLLLVGATGKSAQIPLYVWLPDAMAGPTPVSALIHAATMVTAGIYMITRSHALFALAPFSQNVVALVGGATALFSATIAVGQFDIKRVLAYSTISQLGFMVAAVGLGGYVAGMFHLVTHAFFKALLFLSSGSVIQAVERGQELAAEAAHAHGGGGGDEHVSHAGHAPEAHAGHEAHAAREAHHGPDPQDMRNMGGLWTRLRVTKWVYLVGAVALAGLPPFAGFFSKDEILLDALNHNRLVFVLLLTAAFFTAFYMTRQMLMVFFGRARTEAARHAVESPWVMTAPLVILAVLSVFGGGLNLPGVHTLTDWLGHTLGEHEAGEFNLELAVIATVLALAAIGLSFTIYWRRPETAEERDPLRRIIGPVFTGMHRKWWVDEFYDLIILRPYDWLARFTAEVIDWNFWHDWFHDSLIARLFNLFAAMLSDGVDKGFVDPVISHFPADLSAGVAHVFRRMQTGYVRSYALAVFVGVVGVLGYFLIAK